MNIKGLMTYLLTVYPTISKIPIPRFLFPNLYLFCQKIVTHRARASWHRASWHKSFGLWNHIIILWIKLYRKKSCTIMVNISSLKVKQSCLIINNFMISTHQRHNVGPLPCGDRRIQYANARQLVLIVCDVITPIVKQWLYETILKSRFFFIVLTSLVHFYFNNQRRAIKKEDL